MELVDERPNVELRRGPDGRSIVVLSFPYDPHIVASVRSIPQRRFDWDTREWWAPVDDWAGVHVAEVLERSPKLRPTARATPGRAASQRPGRRLAGRHRASLGRHRDHHAPRRTRLVGPTHARGDGARGAARGSDR